MIEIAKIAEIDIETIKDYLDGEYASFKNLIESDGKYLVVTDGATTQESSEIESYVMGQMQIEAIQDTIKGAISFFDALMVKFAAENVSMGITLAAKTREVSDYLANVLRYGQTGSLFEVINEVDNLISEGVPASLSPFVTEQRLNDFKAKIQEYLS